MSFLSSFISPQRVVNKVALQSQKRIFEVASQLLKDEGAGISADVIYQKLFERERIGSTAIGREVAVPHCRVDGLTMTRLAILTLAAPVVYGDEDRQVSIIIAAIFPQNVSDAHIRFMAELVRFLKQGGILDDIKSANSNEQLCQLFLNGA